MKSLKEITQIITRLKTTKLEVIDNIPDLDSKDNLSKLFAGIKNGTITNDQQAAQAIYGNTYLDSKYTTLKNRLRTRLLNTLFFLDIKPPDQSLSAEGNYKTFRSVFWFKTLLILGARTSAVKLAEKSLDLARKFSLTAEVIQILSELRYQSSVTGALKEYEMYDEQLKIELNNLFGELAAKEYYQRITLAFAKTAALRPEMASMATEFVEKLDAITPKPDSYEFMRNYFLVKNLELQIKQDFKGVVKVAEEAEKFLLSYPHLLSKIRLGEFVLQKLASYLHLKMFAEGTAAAKQCAELYNTGTNSWFIFMEFYFLLAMHTEHFAEAENIFDQVAANQRFQFQMEVARERWRIYEAYLRFAQRITGADKNLPESKKFDMKKFIREVPSYQKDKQGHNVSLLILHILILLEQNDFDSIISRMDALKTYRTRYLQVSSNKQSALFFKMLMIMEHASFSYKETAKKAEKYYERLVAVSSDSDEIQEALQILPFDWLWKRVLEMLKEKEESGII